MAVQKNYDQKEEQLRKKRRVRQGIKYSINAIILLVVFIMLIKILAILSGPTNKNSTENSTSLSMTQEPFFDSQTLYYLNNKENIGDNQFAAIIHALKTLKKDKQMADNEIKKLDLTEGGVNKEAKNQYFFYKGNDNIIYSYVLPPKEKPILPKETTIKITLLGGGATSELWGLYHLRERMDSISNGEIEITYTIEYIRGKYRSNTAYFIKSSSPNFAECLENLGDSIQKTINNNPNDTARNGHEITLSLVPASTTGNQEKIQRDLPFSLDATGKTVTVDGEEKAKYRMEDILKKEIVSALSPKIAPLFEQIRGKLKTPITPIIYKDTAPLEKKDKLTGIGERINRFVTRKNFNSFKEWKSNYKGVGIEFVLLENYNKVQLSEIQKAAIEGLSKVKKKKITIALSTIALLLSLFIVLNLFIFRRESQIKPTSNKQGSSYENKDNSNITKLQTTPTNPHTAPGETTTETVDKKEESVTSGNQEKPDSTNTRQNDSSNEMMEKLKEIKESLYEVKSKMSEDSLAVGLENLDKLRVAENEIGLLIKNPEIEKDDLHPKVNGIVGNLKDFKKKNKKTYLNHELEDIITRLEQITTSEQPSQKPIPPLQFAPKGSHDRDTIQKIEDLKTISTNNQKTLQTLSELVKGVKEKFLHFVETISSAQPGKQEEKIELEQYIIKALNAPIENQTILSQIKQKIENIDKEMNNRDKMIQMLLFINDETHLKLNPSTASNILSKINREEKLSKSYRKIAIALHDELDKMPDKYKQEWFWQLLQKSFLERLNNNIEYFKVTKSGETIYDKYLGQELPLRSIENKHIKKLVTQHHWAQIWDGVIRMSDFFNAYFGDEKSDIKTTMAFYSQKIKTLLGELGYSIDNIKPLTLISGELEKKRNLEYIDKSNFEEVVLKKLIDTGNKKFRKAVENSPVGYERIMYIDRLGLTDKHEEPPVVITTPKVVAYHQGILQSHIASWERVNSRNINKNDLRGASDE
jgi:hypothetical protein